MDYPGWGGSHCFSFRQAKVCTESGVSGSDILYGKRTVFNCVDTLHVLKILARGTSHNGADAPRQFFPADLEGCKHGIFSVTMLSRQVMSGVLSMMDVGISPFKYAATTVLKYYRPLLYNLNTIFGS